MADGFSFLGGRIRRLLGLLPLLLLLSGLSWASGSEDPPASIEMSAAPVNVSVGKPLTVTILYRWNRGWSCEHDPDPSLTFHDLFVTSISPPTRTLAGGQQSCAYTLTVLPTRSGAWTLPQPTVTVGMPNHIPYQATAPAVVVSVGRAAADLAAPSPRPFALRPPEAVHHPLWWLSLCVVLALAAWIVVMLLLRRRGEGQRVQSAHELLMETLARARQSTDGKESAALTSLALRRFAGTLWKFDGPGSTAKEAIQVVRARTSPEEARDFSRLLDELEAVRWAPDDLAAQGVQPTIDDASGWGKRVHQRLLAEEAAARAKKNDARPAVAKASVHT